MLLLRNLSSLCLCHALNLNHRIADLRLSRLLSYTALKLLCLRGLCKVCIHRYSFFTHLLARRIPSVGNRYALLVLNSHLGRCLNFSGGGLLDQPITRGWMIPQNDLVGWFAFRAVASHNFCGSFRSLEICVQWLFDRRIDLLWWDCDELLGLCLHQVITGSSSHSVHRLSGCVMISTTACHLSIGHFRCA